MTLTELADHPSVTPQALYDLRSKARGPRGFRVGRQLRFRPAEVEAWIAGLEAADGAGHRRRARTNVSHGRPRTPQLGVGAHGQKASRADQEGDASPGASASGARRNGEAASRFRR
jgi:predicted DNA-binding transcriptional regulator AlpA